MIPPESIVAFWNILLGGFAVAIVFGVIAGVIILSMAILDKKVIRPEYERREKEDR